MTGAPTLERLIGELVSAADQRLFDTLLGLVTAEQASLLLGLLDIPEAAAVRAEAQPSPGACRAPTNP